MSRIEEIAARLASATPGPWRWDENYGEDGDTGLALTNEAGSEIVGHYNTHCCSFRDDPSVEDNDAEFIAAAPSDVAFLLDLARKQGAALDALDALADRYKSIALTPGASDTDRQTAGLVAGHIRIALEAKP